MPVPDNPIASEPTIKRKRAGAPPVDAASPGGSVLATGVKVFGRYRVEKPIAGGGMGSVYLAVDEETKLDSRRHVVLKALKAENAGDERFRNRFAAEADVLSQFKDERIALCYDYGLFGDVPVLVMEYVEGQSLEEWLAGNGGRVDEETCRDLLAPIAEALDLAHKRGIFHLDVKPANIIVRKTPRNGIKTCLVDFGIARRENASGATTGVWGTRAYMAPECAAGDAPSAAMDVYSLAATAYECVTGAKAYPQGWRAERDVPPIETESPFSFSVMFALSLSPEDRPSSCIAVLDPSLDDCDTRTGEIKPKRRRRRIPPPSPAGLRFVRGSDGKCTAQWDWPDDLDACVWAVADYPVESLSSLAEHERFWISRDTYESRGGVSVPRTAAGPQSKFLVFGATMCFGRLFESAAHCEVPLAENMIKWRVETRRDGWRFWRRRNVLTVTSSLGSIPEIEVRAAATPAVVLSRGSGRRLMSFGPGPLNGNLDVPLDGKAARGEFLRLFIVGSASGQEYLAHPPKNETEVK